MMINNYYDDHDDDKYYGDNADHHDHHDHHYYSDYIEKFIQWKFVKSLFKVNTQMSNIIKDKGKDWEKLSNYILILLWFGSQSSQVSLISPCLECRFPDVFVFIEYIWSPTFKNSFRDSFVKIPSFCKSSPSFWESLKFQVFAKVNPLRLPAGPSPLQIVLWPNVVPKGKLVFSKWTLLVFSTNKFVS